MEADRKAHQARMEAIVKVGIEEVMADMGAKAEANLTTYTQQEMNADWDSHVQEVVTKTVGALEERMEAIVHSTRPEWDEEIPRRSENVTERQEIPKEGATVANVDCKDQGHKEWESGVERRMVPMEEVARKSSRTKKRPRGRRIAAG
jgi:hypothetical protein